MAYHGHERGGYASKSPQGQHPQPRSYGGHPGAVGASHGYGGVGPYGNSATARNPEMRKASSDASMQDDSNTKQDSHNSQSQSNSGRINISMEDMAQLSAAEDDVVPTVFRWEHGGRDVYITGTFNGWTRQIPMHRSGNDFTYIHNLKRGKHAFKFIVDDEWRFAPDQPTVADIEGRINNFIDVTDFKPYTGDKSFEQEKNAAYYSKSHSHGHGSSKHSHPEHQPGEDDPMSNEHLPATMEDPDGEVFTHNMPDLDEYTKDPPPLPPHLRHIILNKPPQLQDTAALPVPQHVALNHLYCTAIRDNMMVLGITQRFRTKFVTTVYYSPELSRT